MIVSPVARRSVSDSVYEQLRDGIVDDTITAGSTLPAERLLAEQAGVNRQAIREAMQRLRQIGLVEIVHGGGAHVLDWRRNADLALLPEIVFTADGRLRPEPALALVRMRVAVGIDMAALAAARRTPEQLDTVRAVIDRLDRLHDGRELDPADIIVGFEDVWSGVAAASGSVAYRMCNRTMRDAALQYVRLFPPRITPTRDTLAMYEAMVDAVGAQDVERARATSRDVLVGAERMIRALVKRG